MALQITTGAGSLVALGVGAGDVYSLITLGQRVGNWWTAVSGDKQFLALLDQDEFETLRRRGLVDLPTFNKRWRKQIRLLANGRPLSLKGPDVEKVLEDMGRFTAVMVCVVATLDAFTSMFVVRRVLKSVLTELLRTTETGEDLLSSQYGSRLNSWRSTACLRGLAASAQALRQGLIDQGSIMSGYLPAEESFHVVEFLAWLLGKETAEFTTPSSDVAGIALCLSQLGVDILQVKGKGFRTTEKPCCLTYSAENVLSAKEQSLIGNGRGFMRDQIMTVPISHPEECLSVFPTSIAVHNRCRTAWKLGERAAQFVSLDVVLKPETEPHFNPKSGHNIFYKFIDRGTECRRTSCEIHELANNHAPIVNHELLSALEKCFERDVPELVVWASNQTRGGGLEDYEIVDHDMIDPAKIEIFCVVQSFFMGYYYTVFLPMVDLSSLKLQTVEGVWGYRSPDFLHYFRRHVLSTKSLLKTPPEKNYERHESEISRQAILALLSRLFLGHPVDISLTSSTADKRANWCMGIVAKRTLMINSLLGKCQSIEELGKFTILDVDVGGVPRDPDGLIRPGFPDGLEFDLTTSTRQNVGESCPPEDVTFHIEADWDTDADATLLCVRYKGRRISTISPATADWHFCQAYVEPIGKETTSRSRTSLSKAVPVGIESFFESPPRLPVSQYLDVPVLFQAFNRPRLQYTAVALYSGSFVVRLASDCIATAGLRCKEYRERKVVNPNRRVTNSQVIVAGSS